MRDVNVLGVQNVLLMEDLAESNYLVGAFIPPSGFGRQLYPVVNPMKYDPRIIKLKPEVL